MDEVGWCVADEQLVPRASHLSIGITKNDVDARGRCDSQASTGVSSDCSLPRRIGITKNDVDARGRCDSQASTGVSSDCSLPRRSHVDFEDEEPFGRDASLESDEDVHACITIPNRSKPNSFALRSRSALKFPEHEQERIAIVLRRHDQEKEGGIQGHHIELEVLRSTMTERMEVIKSIAAEREARRFCKDHGFVDVNAKRKKLNGSKYALHSAVKRCDAHIVEALMIARADPTLINSRQQTPLQLAQAMHDVQKCDMTTIIAVLNESHCGVMWTQA